MSKTFRPWKIDEPRFLPPAVQDFVAKDHLARFMVSLVTEELDLAEITASYTGEKGQPPFHPAMMAALLLYAYCCGIYSSRRIAKACRERVDFMSIVALDPPDFRTICEFRKRHLKALSGLFVQVLKLCEKAGLVKLGHVAFDGTKIKANASKHKAMSYERMEARAAQLEAEVAKWFAGAEAADREEDKIYGSDKQGDEMPDWVADKKRRAEKIRAAKAELEAEAKAAAAVKTQAEAEAEEKRKAEGRKKPGKPAAPPSPEPDPKAQRNFTDSESRIMKSKDGFVQAYNAQAAVDAQAQIIVAQDVTQSAVDCGQLVPMIDAVEAIWEGGPSKRRQTPATARRPTSRRWKAVTSMAMWRPVGPRMLLPARPKMRLQPKRPMPTPRQTRRAPSRLRRVSRPCARRSRPGATAAPTDCVSNCLSRCLGRSNKRAVSASS
jgi:transposase